MLDTYDTWVYNTQYKDNKQESEDYCMKNKQRRSCVCSVENGG